MRIKHRTILRTKELRKLVKEFEEMPLLIHQALRKTQLGKIPVEHIALDDKSELYFVQNELWLVQLEAAMFPGLPALIANNVQLPQVMVDMGAVPHIANGADIMAPGILSIDESLRVNDLAVIIDQKNHVPIAVGRMRITREVIAETRKGRALETLHYVGDQLWKLVKELSEG
jgi:PUA domain protein